MIRQRIGNGLANAPAGGCVSVGSWRSSVRWCCPPRRGPARRRAADDRPVRQLVAVLVVPVADRAATQVLDAVDRDAGHRDISRVERRVIQPCWSAVRPLDQDVAGIVTRQRIGNGLGQCTGRRLVSSWKLAVVCALVLPALSRTCPATSCTTTGPSASLSLSWLYQ